MSPQDVAALAAACVQIGNSALDGTSFVPLRNLLRQFRAELFARPLLVEALVSKLDRPGGQGWAVVVDSETSGLSDVGQSLRGESPANPLPARLRNTIAHELAHSLTYRSTEFGLKLSLPPSDELSRAEYVDEVERLIEQLSPLLLLPPVLLKSWLDSFDGQPDLNDFDSFRVSAGVSRPLLLSRLSVAAQAHHDDLANHRNLRNTALIIGEWNSASSLLLRRWPVFLNFDRGLAPIMLLKLLRAQDGVSAALVCEDFRTIEENAALSRTAFQSDAGTALAPNAARMNLEVVVEKTERTKGQPCLILVRGTLVNEDGVKRTTGDNWSNSKLAKVLESAKRAAAEPKRPGSS